MAARADTFVYVSLAPEKRIQIYRLEPSDGSLSVVDSLPVEGSPGCLTFDPQQKFLFASLRSTSSLASFQVDP